MVTGTDYPKKGADPRSGDRIPVRSLEFPHFQPEVFCRKGFLRYPVQDMPAI
jgi:hypothetical protein